jgi:hypothetical protein
VTSFCKWAYTVPIGRRGGQGGLVIPDGKTCHICQSFLIHLDKVDVMLYSSHACLLAAYFTFVLYYYTVHVCVLLAHLYQTLVACDSLCFGYLT